MEELTMKKLMAVMMILVLVVGVGFAKTNNDYDQYLINALNDDNVGIRTSAAQLLGERKVEQAVEPLIKMVKSEKNTSARIITAQALYKIGAPKAYEALMEVAKQDKNKTVRHVAFSLAKEMENKKFAQL
jgi:HEAT repeat protein